MIYGKIGSESQYGLGEKKFRSAFEFLSRNDLARLSVGSIGLGEGVVANVQRYDTAPAEELSFETHDKFYDIQYVVSGREAIGVCARDALMVKSVYDPENDITLYLDPKEAGAIVLTAGDFIVLAPEDAHKPRCAVAGPAPVQKIVIKVPV